MDRELITALLATAALLVVPLSLVLAVAVGHSRAFDLRQVVLDHVQVPALAIAATAMAGSLYYSEIAHFTPCEFCWYQRIAMYPIAVILLVAVGTRDGVPARYVVVLALIGLGLSTYHYQLQLFPDQATTCSTTGTPCTTQWVDEFDFVSIPFMAGCGFAAILMLYLARWRAARAEERWDS